MDSHTMTTKLESQQPNAGTSYSETTFLVIDPVTRQVDISRCPQIQAHGMLVNFAASRAVHDIDCCKYVHRCRFKYIESRTGYGVGGGTLYEILAERHALALRVGQQRERERESFRVVRSLDPTNVNHHARQ